MIPPNCLVAGHQHDGAAAISFCERCYATGMRTPAEEAVLKAAVAWMRDADAWKNGAPVNLDALAAAVDALLRENPAWGEP